MDRFITKRSRVSEIVNDVENPGVGSETHSRQIVDLNSLPADPALRKKISEYHPNQIDEIRRAYILKKPCQPDHDFPRTIYTQKDGKNITRRFNPDWYVEYANWLECSVKEDKAYCLCCYLFRGEFGNQGSGGAFVSEGFKTWNQKGRLKIHVGNASSSHNFASRRCEDLRRQVCSIDVSFHKHTNIQKQEYLVRLSATVNVIRYLLHQGSPFRGHDEGEGSSNKGNFLELLKYSAGISESIRKVVFENAPKNHQMTSPSIQKDVISCFAKEIQLRILDEINGDFFSLLVDESSDVSGKEQMAVIFRFVDAHGNVKERFIGVTHVTETTSSNLKSAIDNLFAELGLSLTTIRGQGYDGASNMKGKFNGLKTLIMRENKSAYYIHCFAHQLQLALVAVAKKHKDVEAFFSMTSLLTSVVGASCKRKDLIRELQAKKLSEDINNGLVETGSGLNQEVSLKRAGDTRWGSHHDSLINLVLLFSTVVEVLRVVERDAHDLPKQRQAKGLLIYFESFDFVFYLHLMLKILMITNGLSIALQKKDQDIVNAMRFVELTKKQLQDLRDHGWEDLLNMINAFCDEHDIECLDMKAEYVFTFNRRRKSNFTEINSDCFFAIVDVQLSELNDRFTEINSELLICIASLNPFDNFDAFDEKRLMKMAEFYPNDFSPFERMVLQTQLDTYILDVKTDERFSGLNGIGSLSTVLVQTRGLSSGVSAYEASFGFAGSNRKCGKILFCNDHC